jgi:DNA polymerase elongation subunit (family B)
MKHLEDTPWWICDEGDYNFCAYVDTDSNYFNAEPLLKHLYPNFEEMGDEEKDNVLEQVALKYQDIITNDYDRLARDCFNVQEHRLEMKTECVIRSAYFRATRRYAQWITKQEGIAKESLDIKGLEFKKANFPPIFGEFFNDILQQILKGAEQKHIDKLIMDFRDKIMSKNTDIALLGNPTSVKTLNEYVSRKPRAGEVLTELKKGAPANVKAAVKYNDLLRFWQLDKQHSPIVQGDKIKWIYLIDNPYKIEAIGFLSFDVPDRMRKFLNDYADRRKSFETILQSKLENFYTDLGWTLNLNPNINKFFQFQ